MPHLQQTISGEENRAEWRAETAEGVTPTPALSAHVPQNPVVAAPPMAVGAPLAGELSAADRHVRPDELRSALSAIEARRGEAVVGTVSLGEALGQDRAEVTPEEVWQEIYAQRNRARATVKVEEYEKQRRRKRTLQSVSAVVCLLTTATALRLLVGDMGRTAATEPVPVIIPPPPIAAVHSDTPLTPGNTSAVTLQTPQTMAQPAPPTLRNLPTGTTAPGATLNSGVAASGTAGQFGQSAGNAGPLWQMTEQNGRQYLRCWADLPDGVSLEIYTRPFTIYNRPDHAGAAGKTLQTLNLPLDAVTDLGGTIADGFARRQIVLNNRPPRPAAPAVAPPAVVSTTESGQTAPTGPRPVRDVRDGNNRTDLGNRQLPSGETLKEVAPGKYELVPPGDSGGSGGIR